MHAHGVARVRHGVEWTKSHWELVDDVVVDVVLLLDDASELLLVLCAAWQLSSSCI